MSFPAHKKIGRYEICHQIGAGGIGEVYLADDTKLDRKVELKVLPADVLDKTGDRIRRFIQEARAASALNHPNILTIYESTRSIPNSLSPLNLSQLLTELH